MNGGMGRRASDDRPPKPRSARTTLEHYSAERAMGARPAVERQVRELIRDGRRLVMQTSDPQASLNAYLVGGLMALLGVNDQIPDTILDDQFQEPYRSDPFGPDGEEVGQ